MQDSPIGVKVLAVKDSLGYRDGVSHRNWPRNCITFIWEYPTRQNHMTCTLKFWKNIGLSVILMSGMAILTGSAQAQSFSSRSNIFSAQKRLSAKGYYRGPINGRYNRRTMRALSNFQSDHNLARTGRLNPRTCKMLGASCRMK